MIKRTRFRWERPSKNSDSSFSQFLEAVIYQFVNRNDVKIINIQEERDTICGDWIDFIIWYKDKNANKE